MEEGVETIMRDYILAIALVFIVISIFMLFMTDKKETDIPSPSSKSVEYEVTLECERMSAVSVNEHWSYQGCLENLRNSYHEIKTL